MTSDRLQRLYDALENEGPDGPVAKALATWGNYSPVVYQDGRWLPEGVIAYFQGILEIVRVVDPSVPPGLPPHCLDPHWIADFLGITFEELDWPATANQPSPDAGQVGALNRIAGAIEAVARQNSSAWSAVSESVGRLADALAPAVSDIVDSRYIAGRLNCTTTWVADMVRNGHISKGCIVPGTGNGKPWKFYRSKIDAWIESR